MLTTMMSLIVSVANGMTEDQQLAKMISNVGAYTLDAFARIQDDYGDESR